MSDFDSYSDCKPVFGTAVAAMQGAVYTASIDTKGSKSLLFIAAVSAATQHANATWSMTESDDGVTFTAVAADDILARKPIDATETSQVFHAGYRGKKRYVKAAFDDGAAATGQITAMLGHLNEGPFDQDEIV